MASTSRTVRVIFSGSTAALSAAAKRAQADLEGVSKKVDNVSSKLTSIGKVTAIAALAGGAIALTAALRPALGALLLLPGAALAAGAVFATLKVGTAGVGDALKALASGDAKAAAEALGKLSPNARSAVLAMDGFRQKFGQVKASVQDRLFAGLSGDINALGSTYIPILNTGLTSIAGGLNGFARSSIAAANTPFVSGQVAKILAGTGQAMTALAPSGGALVTILAAVGAAAMPLIVRGAQLVTQFLQQKAAFLSSAAGAEWLRTKIAAAVSILSALMAIARNVGSLLASIFTAAQGPGNSLLGTLVQLTAQAAAWAKSAEGQRQLTTLFTLLSQVLQGMLPILGLTGQAILTISNFIGSLPAPVQSVVIAFGSWALVAGLILPKIMGLVGGLISFGSTLASGAGAVVMGAARIGLLGTAAKTAALETGTSALSIVGSWLMMAARATGSAIATGAAWLWTAGVNAATAVASMVTSAAAFVAQWVMIAVRSVAQATIAAGAWLISTGASMATALASLAVAAVGYVASWVAMAAGAMARAVIMAAAWFVALGPIGWVIGAVVGLVALIVANWDTVRNVTSTVWAFVSSMIQLGWQKITSTVSSGVTAVLGFIGRMAEIPGKVGAWFAGMASAAIAKAGELVSWVAGLPGRILAALGRLGSLLLGAGRDLVDGLWRGIQAGWAWLTNAVSNLARTLLDAAKSALGIASPSKEFRDAVGRWIPKGLAIGITANTGAVVRAAEQLANTAVTAATPTVEASRGKVGLTTGAQTVVDAMSRRDAAPVLVSVKIGERELEALVDTRVAENNRELRRRVGA